MDFYSSLQNAYPSVHGRVEDLEISIDELRKNLPIDSREVFDYIRDIRDPEHPLTLEELGVVQLENIKVVDKTNECDVEFTPTIPHCSMATLIGLAIKVQLLRILPRRFKIEVRIEPGTHSQEIAVNKQLADKERVAAALENSHLRNVLDDCILLPEEQELPKSIQRFLEEEKIFDNPKIKYVLQSRQPVKTFRRWLDIANERNSYNSLVNGCKSMKIGCCGGSSCG